MKLSARDLEAARIAELLLTHRADAVDYPWTLKRHLAVAVEATSSAGILTLTTGAGLSRERVRLTLVQGMRATVEMFLADSAMPERVQALGGAALWMALHTSRADLVGCLLRAGADVHAKDAFRPVIHGFSQTPLAAAVTRGDAAVVAALLARGALCTTGRVRDGVVLTTAAEAGHHQVVELLISAGADVEVEDQFGGTPLMKASSQGHVEMVQFLLAVPGIQVDHTDSQGFTALLYATCGGHLEVVDMLIGAGADVNHSCYHGTTALLYACTRSRFDVLKVLVASGAHVNPETAGALTAVVRVLNATAGGLTPLVRGLNARVADHHAQLVAWLLAQGADVHATSPSVRRKLVAACAKHDDRMIALLVAAGADELLVNSKRA